MNGLVLTALALSSAIPLLAQPRDAAAFWELIGKVGRTEDRSKALALLEAARPQYPDRRFEIDWRAAIVHAQMGQYEKSMDIWEAGQRAGLFYGLMPQSDLLKPLLGLPRFQGILARDQELREQAARSAVMRYEVVKPAGYTESRKYPLFLVLHGGGQSIEIAKTYWRSATLGKEWLVAYLQSAQPVTSRAYGWRAGNPDARAGLRRLYDEIVRQYPVDTSRVLIGGMSAGGMMSLDVVFHDVAPVTGFVVNCPVVPADFEPAMADQVRRRGVRGVTITGEKDSGLPRQKEMADAFAKAGVSHRLTVIAGMGHSVSNDFPARVDEALAEVGTTGVALDITYVANEGFLLASGSKKVSIDSLFSGQDKSYADFPSSDLVGQTEQARPPFDGVSVVLASHPHDDHFSPQNVAAHLGRNTSGVFLSTRDAVGQVRRVSPELEKRIRAVCPDQMHTIRTEDLDGIRLEALRVSHGKPEFENLGFRLRWNGVSVLHTGDSQPDGWRAFTWDDSGLDVVFVSPGCFQQSAERGIDLVKNVMKARNVVLMHYKLGRDLERTERIAAELRPHFNRVIVFTKPMESVTLRIPQAGGRP